MKLFATLLLSTLLAGGAQAGAWSDLWFRRDQQGERALQAGDTKGAAELFTDPRRQAYAQLQAHQDAAAAKQLAPFPDATSQYNRGNALAESGDLQSALSAYEAALKHTDLDSSLRSDAQHNRDLVARQLEKQNPSSDQQSASNDQQNGKKQSKDSNASSGTSQPSTAPDASGSENPKNSADKKEQGESRAGSTPPSSEERPSSTSNESKSGYAQQEAKESARSRENHDASSPQASPETAPERQAKTGPQDKGRQSPSRQGSNQIDPSKAPSANSTLPRTEQQMELEQWLRQIPDDPGGLLRRKFLIEHLMKQQQQVQP